MNFFFIFLPSNPPLTPPPPPPPPPALHSPSPIVPTLYLFPLRFYSSVIKNKSGSYSFLSPLQSTCLTLCKRLDSSHLFLFCIYKTTLRYQIERCAFHFHSYSQHQSLTLQSGRPNTTALPAMPLYSQAKQVYSKPASF